MSEGLLVGAGVVLGGYVGYRIVKAKPPKLMACFAIRLTGLGFGEMISLRANYA